MTYTDGLSDLHEEIKVLEKWLNQSLGEKMNRTGFVGDFFI
ncbi:hypothetical protein [Acinetobacter guillouiae]